MQGLNNSGIMAEKDEEMLKNEDLGRLDSNLTQKSLAHCFYNPSKKKTKEEKKEEEKNNKPLNNLPNRFPFPFVAPSSPSSSITQNKWKLLSFHCFFISLLAAVISPSSISSSMQRLLCL